MLDHFDDDEMLLTDSPSPLMKGKASNIVETTRETAVFQPEEDVNEEKFLNELVYRETQPDPDGFFADTNDQVSKKRLNEVIRNCACLVSKKYCCNLFRLVELYRKGRSPSQAFRGQRTKRCK